MLHQVLLFAVLLITIGWQTVSAQSGTLTVAWVDNGDLMAWHQGDTAPAKIVSGNIQQAFVAPDGKHIAFTRGADHRSESLWLVNTDGQSENQLATPDMLSTNMLAQVSWLDATTLYFNTAQNVEVGQVLNDDLWRSDINGTTQQLLASGAGGFFTFSPDREHIAIVHAGDYDGQDGQINLVDTAGKNTQMVLTFPAVSTGSEYRFYPPVFWEADSSAFRVAVPDKDLIYNDSTGITNFWRIRKDGNQERIGEAQASFFGQPQWSYDGRYIVYMRRVGDAADNQFELITTDGNGSNAATYTSGTAGTLQFINWLPDIDQFLFAQGEQPTYWVGRPAESPQALPDQIFAPQFVTDSLYIYLDLSHNPYELRYADMRQPNQSTLMTTLAAPIPQFSAVFAP